jgi:hypothetical protein
MNSLYRLRNFVVGLVALGIGQGLFFADLPRFWRHYRSESWPETLGSVDEIPRPGGLFLYRYEVGGKTFRNGGRIGTDDSQDALVQRALLQTKQIRVFFDPDAPEDSVLVQGLARTDWWMLLVEAGFSIAGVVLCGIVIWECVAERFPRYSIQRRERTSEGQPNPSTTNETGPTQDGIRFVRDKVD